MQHQHIIGVDVAKAQVVIALHGQASRGIAVANEERAISSWLQGLAPGSIVAMEATGHHHGLLARLAHAAGMQVFVLNARDVYFYGRTLSPRAKTDRLDAGVIARYAAEHHLELHAWQPSPGVHEQLCELLGRRAQVSRMAVSLRQTLADVASLQLPGQRLQAQIGSFLEELDAQVLALVASDAVLHQATARIRAIPGYGPQGAAALAALFSRFGFVNADAAVAFAGLDPRACDSGEHRGRRRLCKRGPAWLRRQLYLNALAASHSKALRPMYESIKSKGFAPTQALIILARKLLRVAYAVWKSGQAFDPARLVSTTT